MVKWVGWALEQGRRLLMEGDGERSRRQGWLAGGAGGIASACAYIVVVTREDDGRAEPPITDGVVEGEGKRGAALAVGVEDARLTAYDELVLTRGLDPA